MTVIMLVMVSIAASAQTTNYAILDVGPTEDVGLRFLPANLVEHYRGEYTIGESRIYVYYTGREIAFDTAWVTVKCGETIVRRIPSPDRYIVLYNSEDGWTLAVSFPQLYSGICDFLSTFLKRFFYFIDVGELRGSPPFPAILDIPR